ncbi:thiol reductant ABC exporter subunit CydD [Microbacterium sp.]|uniref:thiol reductant ABC exporter subunit CydD n=1 Tax=unclassified Microbacterium TaxID=2609290 RepID=UPI002631107A|nr:thiol reductant ABC exporter subunit CydD [Microbacterium sp.]
MPAEQDRPTRRGPVDPRLLRYARSSRGFFALIAAIGLAQTLTIVAFAWFLTTAIVDAIGGVPLTELAPTLTLLGATIAVRAVLIWAREAASSRAAARVESELREHLVGAVSTLGPEWLANRNTAQLAVTAGRGLEALDAYFGRYLPQLVLTAIATPILLGVMWWQDWLSGLIVLVTLPLIPIFMVLIGLATRAIQQRQWRTLGQLAARFSDTVQGLSTLKVFGRQHRAADSIESVTTRYRRETMKVLRVSFLSGFMLEFLASIAVAIVAVTIGFRLLDGSLALTVGLFVLLLAPEAYLPLRQVGVQFHAAAEGVAATDDIFAVLDAAASTPARAHLAPAPPGTASTGSVGVLTVTELRVRRGDRVLQPVSVDVAPGRVVLLEGPSGAGKSSILAALRGAALFDGSATIDGADVRAVASTSWLAWAGQSAGLISGTVADNVALGDETPDAALIDTSLRLACADEISPSRELGTQGAGLSGGQAQRVAVARAFYRHLRGKATIIALDEPSAALDAETEARLWASVRQLADRGAGVILVSHRESARQIADEVIGVRASEVMA